MKSFKNKLFRSLRYFCLIAPILIFPQIVFSSDNLKIYRENTEINNEKINLANLTWEIADDLNQINKSKTPIWEINKDQFLLEKDNFYLKRTKKIKSLNRSIIFDNELVGPDISWIVPPGFSWNSKYKFDINARGHNTQIPEPKNKNFFGWNNGDAIGQISYQFLHNKKSSFGLNFGVRSLYQGKEAAGGATNFGEGKSAGFRWDYEISDNAGIAIGAEQLIHFDNTTDSGRNIYLSASKGWWSSSYEESQTFPLYVVTAGLGTGRMAVGSKIRGLCSEFIGDDGTNINKKDRLCWAPVFSVASVWNNKFSTFFEFNNRFVLLGSSLTPNQNIPIRSTIALIIADHIDDYKVHNFEELNWVFNLSVGF